MPIGAKPDVHQLLIDHLTAEYAVSTAGRGRVVEQWTERPNRDNEGWDALVGNAVAASMLGVTVKDGGPARAKRVVDFSELQRAARAAG